MPYDVDLGPTAINLPLHLIAPPGAAVHDLLSHVYGDLPATSLQALDDPTPASLAFLATRTILAPKNEDVRALNDAALERFPAASHVILLAKTYVPAASEDNREVFSVEYLDSLDLPGLPPATLHLCPDASAQRGLRSWSLQRHPCSNRSLTKCSMSLTSPAAVEGTEFSSRAFL